MAPRRGDWSGLDDPAKRAVLEHLDQLAYWLDDRFRVPGTRFRVGLDGLVGLIPGIGDVTTNTVTAYIVYRAWRLGVPAPILTRMLANLGIDFVVGLVPVLGDLFDIGFKANRRNARLLRRHFGDRLSRESAAPGADHSRAPAPRR
jgi:Domain of unknown function (DUF4112)